MLEMVVSAREDGLRDVEIVGDGFVGRRRVTTSYPREMLDAFLAVNGPVWVCDEVARDEDGSPDLEVCVTAYLDPGELAGKRLLDFGCGAGASTARLGRLLPETHLIGVELEPKLLDLARLRAQHHGIRADFHLSPTPDQLPPIDPVDVVLLEAVYEHLLPGERQPILDAIWGALKPGGVLLVNELPFRWFPIEWHTTRLPFLNYLPYRVATRLLPLSKRYVSGHDWGWWLRRGIRGGTQRDILQRLGPTAEPLRPWRDGMSTHADLWFRTATYIENMKVREGLRKLFAVLDHVEPMEPILALGIRKRAN